MIVRPATTGDDAAIAAVARAAGQEGADSADDAAYLVALHADSTLLVAEDDHRVVAFGAVTDTAQGSILSDLFVHPGTHARGAGSALLRALWPDAGEHGPRFTFSSLHPSALPLYARAGLVPGWPLLYLTGRPSGGAEAQLRTVPVSPEQASQTEAGFTGRRRDAAYACWTAGEGGRAFVVRNGDAVVAVGAGTPTDLAHLACTGPQWSEPALLAGLSALAGPHAITTCLPGPHPAVRPLLEAGFRVDYLDVSMATADLVLETGWAYSPGLA